MIDRKYILAAIVILFHLVGIVGTLYPTTRAITLSLTPLNLLLTAILLLLAHRVGTISHAIPYLFISSILGLLVEILGVQTGFPFGEYTYGGTLGWKVADVPWVIGINWFILSYCFGTVVSKYLPGRIMRVLSAATGMVLLDFLIEPVAIQLDYWSWHEDGIPASNYIAWFFIALIMQVIMQKTLHFTQNPIAKVVILAQLCYFAAIILVL